MPGLFLLVSTTTGTSDNGSVDIQPQGSGTFSEYRSCEAATCESEERERTPMNQDMAEEEGRDMSAEKADRVLQILMKVQKQAEGGVNEK